MSGWGICFDAVALLLNLPAKLSASEIESNDITAIEDSLAAQALKFIDNYSMGLIQVIFLFF